MEEMNWSLNQIKKEKDELAQGYFTLLNNINLKENESERVTSESSKQEGLFEIPRIWFILQEESESLASILTPSSHNPEPASFKSEW